MPDKVVVEIPDNLRAGRRALDGMPGVAILRDWAWDASTETWVLWCRLTATLSTGDLVPPETDWYVLVDSAYPWGTITFYPAKERGLAQTFPHQNYNGAGPVGVPWRQGDPCLDTSVRTLGRHGYDSEPYGVHERLRWRFQRALDWLVAVQEFAR